jgi:hypothetical protein
MDPRFIQADTAHPVLLVGFRSIGYPNGIAVEQYWIGWI